MSHPNAYEDTSRTVDTRIGALEYVGGFPTPETVQKAYDQLDVQRATQVYLEFMPFMSQQAIFDSHERESGMGPNGDIGVYDYQAQGKVNSVGLTYNTESIYCSAYLDVSAGPIVVDTPPNILGVIDDGWMRYITDLGNAGPDQGQGGTFVLAHVDDTTDLPNDAYVFRTPTYRNWVMARAFVDDTGEGESAMSWYRENFRIHPLGSEPDPAANYVAFSQQNLDTTHARDFRFFERLAEIVQHEPGVAFTPYELGLLKAIGIEKGQPFAPDERMRTLLTEGIEIGDAVAKSNAYANRLDGVRRYPDRMYEHLFMGGRHDFMSGDALWLDARLLFHYEAIVVTPAMAMEMVGIGSQYLACYRDADGDYLMGQHSYRLHLPPDIPAANFWSVTVYHPETRSLLANDQDKPARNSYDDLRWNDDGSVDLFFGPEAPEGYEGNWVKTLPDEGWEILLRLYGPLEAYFDGTWKPDDFVRLS
ncbi:MAG: DUF1254 domain-containing protein [Hyphomicrobiaceae bacterium]